NEGIIPQVEMTSNGPNDGPLPGKGEYPAYIACHLYHRDEEMYTGDSWMDSQFPKITQDGKDGDKEEGYIMKMTDSATAGFKYFDCENIKTVRRQVRGYCKGEVEVKTAWDGITHGKIPVDFSNVWKEYSANINIP